MGHCFSVFNEVFLQKNQPGPKGDRFPTWTYLFEKFGFKSRRGKFLVLSLASYGPGKETNLLSGNEFYAPSSSFTCSSSSSSFLKM